MSELDLDAIQAQHRSVPHCYSLHGEDYDGCEDDFELWPCTISLLAAEVRQLRNRLAELEVQLPAPEPDCWCARCWGAFNIAERHRAGDFFAGRSFMHICPDCGNKRCPRAAWHGWQCNGSNDSGQVGVPVVSEGETPNA